MSYFPNSQEETFDNSQFNDITGDMMSFFSDSWEETFDSSQFNNNVTGDATSLFSNHGATFYDGSFNSIAGDQYNNTNSNGGIQYNNNGAGNQYNSYSMVNFSQTVLLILWEAIKDVGAAHNSAARDPQPRCHPETRAE
ncbi:hypothetical protein V5O48_018050, partial [Marasmius crinis-equi]